MILKYIFDCQNEIKSLFLLCLDMNEITTRFGNVSTIRLACENFEELDSLGRNYIINIYAYKN